MDRADLEGVGDPHLENSKFLNLHSKNTSQNASEPPDKLR